MQEMEDNTRKRRKLIHGRVIYMCKLKTDDVYSIMCASCMEKYSNHIKDTTSVTRQKQQKV